MNWAERQAGASEAGKLIPRLPAKTLFLYPALVWSVLVLLVCFSRPAVAARPEEGTPAPTSTLPAAPGPIPATPNADGLCSPLAENRLDELPRLVSDGYHPPPGHSDERHPAVDLAYFRRNGRLSILGETVQSALPGRVVAVAQDRFPFGNMVLVETPLQRLPARWVDRLHMSSTQSLYLLYAHLQSLPPVQVGQLVAACQAVGQVGASGNALVPHLHWEARVGPAGTVFNSLAYYVKDATPEERTHYRLWSISGTFRHFDPLLLIRWSLTPNLLK